MLGMMLPDAGIRHAGDGNGICLQTAKGDGKATVREERLDAW